MKQRNWINPSDRGRPRTNKSEAAQNNAIAERMRAEAAARVPAVPAPVYIPSPKVESC